MRARSIITAAVCAAVLIAAAPSTDTTRAGRYKLENGVSVLLYPQENASLTAINVWVHVGSKDETDETRGLAHIQEHVLFQKTDDYAFGETTREAESAGADFNAYTYYDQTVYQFVAPPEATGTGLNILASMMFRPRFEKRLMDKELEVVMEEFNESKDSPEDAVDEALYATMFSGHTYAQPILGYEKTIRAIQPADAQAFHDRWYVPQNMTVVVAGKIDPNIRAMIAKAFGAEPARENPKRDVPPPAVQTESRAVITEGPFGYTKVEMGFRTPGLSSADIPALDVLFHVLGGGDNSRLVRALVQNASIATDAYAANYPNEDAGAGIIQLEVATPADLGDVVASTLRQAFRLREEQVTEKELAAAKNAILAARIQQQEHADELADWIGSFEVVGGGMEKDEAYRAAVEGMTRERLQQVARTYLLANALTVSVLYPDDAKNRLSEKDVRDIIRTEDGRVDRMATVTKRSTDPDTGLTTVRWSNGMTMLVLERRGLPTFAATADFLGGQLSETKKTNGISTMASDLLLSGTDRYSAAEIMDKVDALGATFQPFRTMNEMGLSVYGLSTTRRDLLSLMADVLIGSTFSPEDIDAERDWLMDEVRYKEDEPDVRAFDQMVAALFREGPYALPDIGTLDSLRGIDRSAVRDYARAHFTPRNMVLTVVGDVRTDDVVNDVSELFGRWSGRAAPAFEIPADTFPKKPTLVYDKARSGQSHIYVAFPGSHADDRDIAAFLVFDQIFAGTSGRLFHRLRDDGSLAYSIYSETDDGYRSRGYYAVYMSCDAPKTDAAIAAIRAQIDELLQDGVTDQEVEDAKGYVRGAILQSRQSNAEQADILATYALLPGDASFFFDYRKEIDAVDAEDVMRMARRYLAPSQPVVSVVGPVQPAALQR